MLIIILFLTLIYNVNNMVGRVIIFLLKAFEEPKSLSTVHLFCVMQDSGIRMLVAVLNGIQTKNINMNIKYLTT